MLDPMGFYSMLGLAPHSEVRARRRACVCCWWRVLPGALPDACCSCCCTRTCGVALKHTKTHKHNPHHPCVCVCPCTHAQVGEEEIKSAYRRLALQLHPDRHVNASAAAKADAAKRFAALLRAYDTLRDPDRRALYDAGQLVEASLEL